MSMYEKNHYNIVISLQLIKRNGGKKQKNKQKINKIEMEKKIPVEI